MKPADCSSGRQSSLRHGMQRMDERNSVPMPSKAALIQIKQMLADIVV